MPLSAGTSEMGVKLRSSELMALGPLGFLIGAAIPTKRPAENETIVSSELALALLDESTRKTRPVLFVGDEDEPDLLLDSLSRLLPAVYEPD